MCVCVCVCVCVCNSSTVATTENACSNILRTKTSDTKKAITAALINNCGSSTRDSACETGKPGSCAARPCLLRVVRSAGLSKPCQSFQGLFMHAAQLDLYRQWLCSTSTRNIWWRLRDSSLEGSIWTVGGFGWVNCLKRRDTGVWCSLSVFP